MQKILLILIAGILVGCSVSNQTKVEMMDRKNAISEDIDETISNAEKVIDDALKSIADFAKFGRKESM